MPKNNKLELKSMGTSEGCLECRCGMKIHTGSSKAKIMIRLHNQVCPLQVKGHYHVDNVIAHRTMVCHK